MSVFKKAISANDIVNGGAVVCPGISGSGYMYDNRARTQHLASGDSLSLFKTLDGRYLADTWADEYADLPGTSGDVSVGASNAAAVVTYSAAGVGRFHAIKGVAWGYDDDPVSGSLEIEDGSGNVIFSTPVTDRGPGFFEFPEHGKRGSDNTDMIVTLAPGGSGVIGTVSVLAHRVV